MYTVYHNPRCSKSRAGLEYVKSKSNEVEVVEYLKEPFTEDGFKKLLMKLNNKPIDMIRTQEAIYKSDFKTLVLLKEERLRSLSWKRVTFWRFLSAGWQIEMTNIK